MFCLIWFVVISSLLVVSPTVAKLSLLGQPESRDLPTRVRRVKIPEARGGVARRCEARTTPQHELAGHKFCRCTRRPFPDRAEAPVSARMRRNPPLTEAK